MNICVCATFWIVVFVHCYTSCWMGSRWYHSQRWWWQTRSYSPCNRSCTIRWNTLKCCDKNTWWVWYWACDMLCFQTLFCKMNYTLPASNWYWIWELLKCTYTYIEKTTRRYHFPTSKSSISIHFLSDGTFGSYQMSSCWSHGGGPQPWFTVGKVVNGNPIDLEKIHWLVFRRDPRYVS